MTVLFCSILLLLYLKLGFCFLFPVNESHSIQIQNQKQNLSIVPKTFLGNETSDGKTVVTPFDTIFFTSSSFRISRLMWKILTFFFRLMWLMD